jgi:uncharacterized membrane protein YesL
MQQLVEDDDRDEGLLFREFWKAFRKNFKQATLLWLLCLVVFAFLTLYYGAVFAMGGTLGTVYRVSFFVLCIVFLFGYQYIFPLQAKYQNKILHTLKNAWLLSVAAFPWTVLSILVLAAAVYVSFLMNTNNFTMAIYLWAVCGFGILCYLNSFIFRRAFRKMTPEMEKGESRKAEGALFTDESHRKDDLMIQESSYSNPYWNQREVSKPANTEQKKRRKK